MYVPKKINFNQFLSTDPDIIQDVPVIQTQEEEEKNMKRKSNIDKFPARQIAVSTTDIKIFGFFRM